jgi:hypothetical protein
MFNPLLSDLSKLKDQEIDNKITELMKKYTIAAKAGQRYACNQILLILDSYKTEQLDRYQKNLKKSLNSNKNLDDYINIDN